MKNEIENKLICQVKSIQSKEAYDFILNKHYAGRLPSISYSYGLFKKDMLVGVLTIGKPASHSLCVGICGPDYHKGVYELNRLVVEDGLPKNTLSKFVADVLKKMKEEKIIIVSYADEGMGHHGYIYQATNWWYTGKTKGRTDKYTPPGKHSRHYTNQNEHLRKVRTSKYRYVYVPNKKYRKEVLEKIKYPIINEYPKGENNRYVLGEKMKQKVINKNTGEFFFE